MAIDLVAVLRLDDQMSGSLKKMAGVATVGFAAIGAAAVAATSKFAEIDAELRRTASLSGATSAEFQLLTQAATDMGSNSTKSMLEISESMSELAANGMTANEVMSAMPGIIAASEASGESLAVAASTVSAALNTWNLEASESGKVADILTMAANVSAAGIDDMAYALKYASAPAAALGMDLAQVSAAIGAMVDSGIDGSSAGTSLRAALLALNNPAKTQAKMMDKLGISVTDAAGEAKTLVDIVRNVEDATRSMTDADKLATIAKLTGTEAASGFLALMNRGPDELAKMTDALRDSDGLAQATADEMNKGVGALIKGIKSQLEAFGFQVGKGLEPISLRLLEMIKGIDFNPLIEAASKVGDAMSSVFDVVSNNWSKIAPILKPISMIVAGIGASFMLIGGASAVFLALSVAIGFITGPIALVALGIGALIGAFAILYDKVAPFRNKVTSMFDGLKVALGFEVNMPKAPKVAEGTGGATMLDEGNQAPQSVEYLAYGAAITKVFDSIKAVASSAMDVVREKIALLQPGITMMSQVFANAKDITVSVLTTLWGVAGPILSLVGNALKIVADIAVMAFNNIIAPAFLMISTGVSAMWKILGPILELFGVILQGVGDIVLWLWTTSFAPFLDYLSSGMLAMADIVMPILENIDGIFSTIGGTISGVIEHVKTFVSNLGNIKVPEWVTGIGEKASSIVSKFVPGHYHGLANVPYDNMHVRVHRNERILTAQENKAYSNGSGGGGGSITIAKLADQIIIREDADITRITDGIVSKLLERRGVAL